MTTRNDTERTSGGSDTLLSPEPSGERPASRHLRVVPVLFALVVVAVVALAVSPGLRHQLAQSFTRQDKGYLEVFFVNEQSARTCPLDDEGRVRLEVGVRSHYEGTRSLAWTVTVSPTRGTVQDQRGRLDARPDTTGTFTTAVPIPRSAAGAATPYTVSVAIAGHAERLLLHC